MDPQKTEWEGVDWINLAQDRNKWQAVKSTAMSYPVT